MNTIDLSILVVNWNTHDFLCACLTSLEAERINICGHPMVQKCQTAPSCEVIVVDNASQDGSIDMVHRKFPWVRLIENDHNVGFALANNQAIVQSRGRYVLLLNSDTIVHPGALEELVTFMDGHPLAGACGARLLNGDGTLQHACHPMLSPQREVWRLLLLDHLYPRATYPMARWNGVEPRPVETIKGACLLLRRQALDEIGLLDDRYFMYTEEVDLCYRLALAGRQLWYVPTAVVTHFGGRSSVQTAEEMYMQLYRSKIQFFHKFGGRPLVWRAKLFFAFAYLPRWTLALALSLIRPSWHTRSRTYRRLLAELPGM
ncbi:MAG: glycosyltransferase family 2 protein [Caldilineaceae bacterium]|nr:glycosyltransferase family 2 protein [Caldilineaceae bacterium]